MSEDYKMKICSQVRRKLKLLFMTILLLVIFVSVCESIKRTQYHEQVSYYDQSTTNCLYANA